MITPKPKSYYHTNSYNDSKTIHTIDFYNNAFYIKCTRSTFSVSSITFFQ